MNDKEKTLQQLLDELGQETKPYSKNLAQFPLYQEFIKAAKQQRQNYKIKRDQKWQPEPTTVQGERLLSFTKTPLPDKDKRESISAFAERFKRINNWAFSITPQRQEVSELLMAGGIREVGTCLYFIELYTKLYINTLLHDRKQSWAQKEIAPNPAQADWISSVRNALIDCGFNGYVQDMVSIVKVLTECFAKELNIDMNEETIRRKLAQKPKLKVKRLSKEDRKTIWQHDQLGYSNRYIAEEFGISLGTVTYHLKQYRKQHN